MCPLCRVFVLGMSQRPRRFLEIVRATPLSSPSSSASLWKSVIFPVSPHGHKWQGRNLITVIGGLPRGRGGHLNTREN